jgi:uncharacterized membrane protein (UPF0127 family)
MKKDFCFKYKNRFIRIPVEECDNFVSQTRGLMFRKTSSPLLFSFNSPVKMSIHSFFCIPFYAIWFEKTKIVDEKLIMPWNVSVCPTEKFDKLLEIPSNDKFFKFFTDERKV